MLKARNSVRPLAVRGKSITMRSLCNADFLGETYSNMRIF